MDNYLYIPYINPVKFVAADRANLPIYFTKHFEDYLFSERLYNWQTASDFIQPWQTTDIIYLQFSSTFDPIIVELVDSNGVAVITLPALVGLPNIYYPNTYSFEVSMSLASVTNGCYRLKITAGTGDDQKIYISGWQYISESAIENTLLWQYYNSRFHEDVLFETGIQFQRRFYGFFGFLKPGRSEERYKDQRYNPSLLSARTFRQFEISLGDEFGMTDDDIDLVNRICGCNNIYIDNKSFAVAEGATFEFTDFQDFPKRGVKLLMEEGINRASRIYATESNTGRKLQYGIVVEAKVWGDTSNQGSSNTVPLITVE